MALADRTATADDSLDSFFPVPSAQATNNVHRELECIQFRTQDSKELFKSKQASEMIRKLSPEMVEAFKRFNMSGMERAFFYSQMLEESAGMTILAETKNMKAIGYDPMDALIADVANEPAFKERKGATTSNEFGKFRGRGLIQISRCDNYLSIIHYLNQKYSKDKALSTQPEWKGAWEITAKDKTKTLGAVCSPEDIRDFSDWYRTKTKMNPNLYGALEDPRHFSMLDSEFLDPGGKKKISSERFMLDANMAFWRGHCGKLVDNVMSFERIKDFEPCKKFADADYLVHATKCLTKCVKGKTDGWERRLRWLKEAMLCSRL